MDQKLIQVAQSMRSNSHAPFSNFFVGAAVKTNSGKIIGGCNIEFSSYGLTCCAERVALFRAIAEGYYKFTSMAVATDNGAMPCGACRQVIWELCNDIPIFICDCDGYKETIYSSTLLPYAFDKSKL